MASRFFNKMQYSKIFFLRFAFTLFILSFLELPGAEAQYLNKKLSFTRQDTLRGSVGAGRLGWDVLKYNITVEPDFSTKSIRGKNIISFFDIGVKLMQLDLQEPMQIDSISYNNRLVSFRRDGNVFFLMLRDSSARYKIKPDRDSITVHFSGTPREAVKPPWDGGWIWKKDKQGNPWMSVACQGLGASAWYPCKDIQSDEPGEGALLNIIVPDSLVAVGNGRLIEEKALSAGKKMYSWQVKNPINNYNIVPYIGKYVHFQEIFPGLKGKLDMDYWVLNYNLEKARIQFADAPRMMKAFEYWFGPYPFYEDGYKLVEAPHLGMEHQGAIAYGNEFQNGYLGRDLSGSGWGKKFDFIIVHESGHEWFANNITSNDIADMWIHEGFTNYSETLFTEYYFGKEAGNDYLIGSRKNIVNDIPIIGPYGVNKEGSGDMYCKAGNMLHLIRQVMKNDAKFRAMLIGLNKTFYHQTVSTKQIEGYINKFSGINFSKLFDQYLRTTQVPVLELKEEGKFILYRFSNSIDGFTIPVKLIGEAQHWVKPTQSWQQLTGKRENFANLKLDRNFYIITKKLP